MARIKKKNEEEHGLKLKVVGDELTFGPKSAIIDGSE